MSQVYVHVLLHEKGLSTAAMVRLEQTIGVTLKDSITPPLCLSGAGTGTKGGSQYAIHSLSEALPYLSLPFCLSLITGIIATLKRMAGTHPNTPLKVDYAIPADSPTSTGTLTTDPVSQEALLAALLTANPHEPILLELRQAE